MARVTAGRRSPGAGGAAVVVWLLLAGACGSPVPAPISDRSVDSGPWGDSAAAGARPSRYEVQSGDTLYAIAWRFGLDYRQLAAWNGIEPPYVIRPGRRLSLVAPPTAPAPVATAGGVTTRPVSPPPRPVAPAPADEAPATRAQSTPKPPRPAAKPPRPVAKPPDPAPVASATAIQWRWPADGEVIGEFVPGRQRGLDIGGEPGQPVVAAAAGEVVYSGVGLVGYGELIIIKHDEEYLSAYAHNRRRLVEEGERVAAGGHIAEMGDSGTDRPKLHFEIRRQGQPVDPRRYLPAR